MHHLNRVENTSTEGFEFISEFAEDVFLGLSHNPKWLSSKYFYDEPGDKIFQEIMEMESYYLTRSEFEIFENEKEDILQKIYQQDDLQIIELGAGDGSKTKVLLEYFLAQGASIEYMPCDISGHVLDLLQVRLKKELPDLRVRPLQGDYFDALAGNSLKSDKKSVILFLGSNIGNFSNENAINFLKKIRSNMKEGDNLMVGFDLKKDPEIILDAYNDKEGITARFNFNLLERINRELKGNFDITKFQHYPVYDPISGECRSYLLSTEKQEVYIEDLDQAFSFEAWETIFTEVSKKYDLDEIAELGIRSGFTLTKNYFDRNRNFVDTIWEAI